MLIGRKRELEGLDYLLRAPAPQLAAIVGRRRLGKTTLLTHWAQTRQHPYIYWVASPFPSSLLLRQFSQRIWQHGYPDSRVPSSFAYESWSEALEELARICRGEKRHIVLVDEFPCALDSEPGLPLALQDAWDRHFQSSNVCLVLCGSSVGVMERLLGADAPLHGRMVGPLRVRPLPFAATKAFFPSYDAEKRITVYAVLGGVPAYLEQFAGDLSLNDNIRQSLMKDIGLLRTDPDHLIGEQVRDLSNYQAVLTAIAGGAHRPIEIARAANLSSKAGAGPYLARLQEMDYVRCELPVTVAPGQRSRSRLNRYLLTDDYLRFYFCFVRPHLDLLAQGLYSQVEYRISEQLCPFVGRTAFREQCQEWVRVQSRAGKLPFVAEQVGAHWGGGVEVDIVAVNWHERAVLLGEARWDHAILGPRPIQELIGSKASKVLALLPDGGAHWAVHYAFFARRGFSEAAQILAGEHGAQLVDLELLDHDLTSD
jgi:AAA+ ATPase superfamily predicted ATPase